MLKNNTLTLFFTPSPLGFDWSNPQGVAFSAVKNKLTFKRRFMGHVYIAVKGMTTQGEMIEFVTGMVAKKLDAVPRLLFQGFGMGILFHSFDGHLESKQEVWPEISKYAEQGNLSYLQIKLNTKAIDQLNNYYQAFKENNLFNYYGFVNRPLCGEGGGCSAFGASFLTALGIMEEEWKKSWTNKIRIPLHITGKPVTNNWVGLPRVLAFGHAWAQANEPHQELHFWDPDKMHHWVQRKTLEHTEKSDYQLAKFHRAHGIVIDKSQIQNFPDHIWQHLPLGAKVESIKPSAPFKGPWLD